MTFSLSFLHAVTFLHVFHLDVLRGQIEIETETNISLCMAIMLDHHGNPYIHSSTVLCDTEFFPSTATVIELCFFMKKEMNMANP